MRPADEQVGNTALEDDPVELNLDFDDAGVHEPPLSACVLQAGEPKDVIATLREMRDGTFHYDLNRDVGDGARFNRTSISAQDR